MEPVSIPAEQAPKKGSLEDPEVLQNVPGHVIPILQREYDDFKTEATKFLAGGTEEDEFIKFRLRQGVYGQRQPDVQMIRVKLPFGGITPEQMDKFADVVEKYTPLGKGHVTTRQNVQMHHIPLPEIEKAISELGEAGLSSREGCGNTVRNVTGDPWAGVAADELFDLTPYAGAYVRYFVRHPTTQGMPRKIKTSFDGSPRDRAISGIHDIAFRARVKEIDGRGEVRGVEMLVGGGTSIMPRVAPVLYDFVEIDNGDYLKISEAVFRIFDRQEWLRVNRARARIKVFVDKYGIDELRNQVEQELEGEWVAERDFSSRIACSSTTSARAPRRRRELWQPQRRHVRVRALPPGQRGRPEAGGIRDGRGEDRARRPHPRAVQRPRPDHARSLRAATRARPSSRTSCCAGYARRASTTCGARSPSLASATPARARSPTWSPAPAQTPASSGSRARWASTRPCKSGSKRWASRTP